MKNETYATLLHVDAATKAIRVAVRNLRANHKWKPVDGKPGVLTNTDCYVKQGVEFTTLFQGTQSECKNFAFMLKATYQGLGYTKLKVSDAA